MHQLVQNAIEAAKCGDKDRAQGYLKQVLTDNPNDLDGWLALASVLVDPEKKRQCFNRALSIDPANKIARQEMLKLDRVASREMFEIVQPSILQTTPPAAVTTISPDQPGAMLGKPQVFAYPLWARVITYLITILLILISATALIVGAEAAPIFVGAALFPPFFILFFSERVEVRDEGITHSSLLQGKLKMAWYEIARFRTSATSQNLDLISIYGKEFSIPTHLPGYSKIVEILRRKRPDLFAGQWVSPDGVIVPKVGFSGEEIFKCDSDDGRLIVAYVTGTLSFFMLWGFISKWGASSWVIGFPFLVFGVLLVRNNLLAVQQLIVRPRQITLVKKIGEEQLTQSQIANIKIETVHRRRGGVRHIITIQRASGGSIRLRGMREAEVIYRTLMNWWKGANS